MPSHNVRKGMVFLQYECACAVLNLTVAQMPFHTVHTDVDFLQYEYTCVFAGATADQIWLDIFHIGVAFLQHGSIYGAANFALPLLSRTPHTSLFHLLG